MIGIENVNEFYTNHYLDAILAGELAPHLERWREDGGGGDSEASTPWRRLARAPSGATGATSPRRRSRPPRGARCPLS